MYWGMSLGILERSAPSVAADAIQIRIGYELIYDCPQQTPMILTLRVHPTRAQDLVGPDLLTTDPHVPASEYYDSFGNLCTRLMAPAGRIRIATNAVIHDSGQPDTTAPWASQSAVEDLPEATLRFLLGSRYCETDQLSQTAWNLFGHYRPGWSRVQAICDFVHDHVQFGYEYARTTKTALETFTERTGVCRDFAHLAVAFCRCLNIPARYCTGYLGDIGVPLADAPMDFAGWFEAYLDGRWFTFDPRNHVPRIGRVLIARGHDAADVAISSTFGASTLAAFHVLTELI
jgi:transglutaminase-like putative cysteine protease